MRDRALGSTIRMQFVSTNPDGGGAPVAPSSAFVVADIRIYKDGSATEKATTNGLTVTSPFDSITGLHLVEIDTSNSTGDVGFWASGSAYHVRLVTAKTVATYSVSGLLIGEFSIELQTADVRKFGGTAITAAAGIPEVKVASIAANAVNASSLATDAVTEIQTGLASQTSVDTLGGAAAVTVERSIADTNAITFAWPVSGATITATRSIDNAVYGAVQGAIAFLRTESSKHYYTLAYDADDRPTAEGQVRYKFVDGTYTRYVVLRVAVAGLASTAQTQLNDIETAVDAGNNYHVTTLARLGAWTGTGINTILGAFRALAAKATGLTPTDISTSTTFDNTQHSLEAVATTSPQRLASVLERPPTDTGVITFVWPASGATITGTVSIDNAAYTPITGAIAFLRTDGGKYFYTLAYDADDRPTTAGSARYALTDGDYTRYIVLRVVESGDTGETTAIAVLCTDWTTITGEVPSRSVLNALRHIRNKWALDGTTKTVYAEDGTTPAFTTTVTADGAGNITADTPN